MTVSGSIVAITGASRGIGRAIAMRLAREQPKHIIVGYNMNYAAAQATVGQLRELGVESSAQGLDLGQGDSIDEFFDRIAEEHGVLDILVNNAARAAFGRLDTMSMKSWQRTMDINLRAFVHAGRRAAELMRERGGHIIGLSSLGSMRVAPGYSALGAAKAALETTAKYMAVELAERHINVNVVCGGLIDTEGTRMLPDFETHARSVAQRTPAGRIGQPEDLAGIVAFLCSEDAQWIRGQTLVADGGFTAAN